MHRADRIRRLPGGAIDTDHYLALGRRRRSRAALAAARALRDLLPVRRLRLALAHLAAATAAPRRTAAPPYSGRPARRRAST